VEILKLKPIVKRKSGFEDAFFVIAVIFTISIFILILAKSWGEMRTPLEEGITGALPSGSDVNVTKTFDNITSTTSLFSTLLPFILIGLFAFVFIGTAIYMNHPIMLVVGIIILAVAILLSSIYANIYHQISESDEFAATNDELPIQEIFMQYLPFIIMLIFIAIIISIIFLRGKSAGGGL